MTSSFARTETYNDVQNLIRSVCNRFHHNRGGNYHELLSEANFCYLSVYDSFDGSKAKFSTWLYRKIWWYLLEWERETKRKKYRHRECKLSDDFDTPLPESFDLDRLCIELSQDAAEVVRLAMELSELDNARSTKESKRRRNARGHGLGRGTDLEGIPRTHRGTVVKQPVTECCPFCHGNDLFFASARSLTDGETLTQQIHCENCGRDWELWYKPRYWWPYNRFGSLVGNNHIELPEKFKEAGHGI